MIVNRIKELPWHPERKWNTRSLDTISKIIVHQELADGSVEAANNYHITPGSQNHLSKKGAPHFAYHYGIEKDGTIVQANELTDVTWHVSDHNTESIGIMLVGDFLGHGHTAGGRPTIMQLGALYGLLDMLINIFPQLSKDSVYGHSDFGKQACPGYDVCRALGDYKNG